MFMKPILSSGGICVIRRFYIQDMKQNAVLLFEFEVYVWMNM